MDIVTIRDKYKLGEYTLDCAFRVPAKLPNDYIFDENLTVKANRELVVNHNKRVEELKKEKTKKQRELNKKLRDDVVTYIIEDYSLSKPQAELVENFVYNEYHSCMYDYFNSIDTFADFAESIVNCDN